MRRNLEDLAHDLLAAKRLEELEVHDFALGVGASEEGTASSQDVEENITVPTVAAGNTKELADAGAIAGVDGSPGGGNTPLSSTDVASVDIATAVTNAADARDTSGDGGVYEEVKKERTTDEAAIGAAGGGEQTNEDAMVIAAAGATSSAGGDTATVATQPAASGPRTASSNEEGGRALETAAEQASTQAAGEAATEPASGGSRGSNRADHEGPAEGQPQISSATGEERSSPSLPNIPDPTKLDRGDVAVGVEEVTKERFSNPSKTLPDTLAQEIGDRAFPLARASEEQEGGSSGGVSCAAFHALAAEAVWAGLNGSNRVEKPPQSVWDPRGGDRWGTAAFFAEQIGKRDEEMTPGLQRRTKTLIPQVDHDSGDSNGGGSDGSGGSVGGCSGEHPLSGSSSRHATARTLCMGAMSSRRGFLQQAAETAAQEVRAEEPFQ